MDDRIIHDPHLEVIPDHTGPHYDVLRNTLTQNGMNVEQAVQALNDSWTQNHKARVQAWDQQVAEDAAAAQALANQMAAQQPPVPEEEVPDVEKKKAKMKDFDDTTTVGNYIAPRLAQYAQYALRRIKDFEYIELWYLTPEGCTDATQHQLSQHNDVFGLTKVDDMVTLKLVIRLSVARHEQTKQT